MTALHHLTNGDVSIKAGRDDCVVIESNGEAVVIFHDEIDELCELLQKLKEKKQ